MWARRTSETVTENDVIRELLGLAAETPATEPRELAKRSWVVKGTEFPHGTEFRATYKGKMYNGEVNDGALVFLGQRHATPSAAVYTLTNTNVNGWTFWECKRPGDKTWKFMDKLRQK